MPVTGTDMNAMDFWRSLPLPPLPPVLTLAPPTDRLLAFMFVCNGCFHEETCHEKCPVMLKNRTLAWLSNFKFNELHTELRNMILKEVFTSKDGGLQWKKGATWSVQLLSVCKEWNEYGKKAIYAGNIVKFNHVRRHGLRFLPRDLFRAIATDSMHNIRHVDLQIGLVATARFRSLALFTGLRTLNITDRVRHRVYTSYEKYADPAFLSLRMNAAHKILSYPTRGFSELNVGRLGVGVKITHTVHRCLPADDHFHCQIVWSVAYESGKLVLRLVEVVRLQFGRVSEITKY